MHWNRVFTRENLGKFSTLASVSIFINLIGVRWFSWVAVITLEAYFVFASIYFGRQKQDVVCIIFAVLSISFPLGVLYLNLYGVEEGIAAPNKLDIR